MAASNSAAHGSSRISPSRNSALAGADARASVMNPSARSTPTTVKPRAASASEWRPLPQGTSSTRAPGVRASFETAKSTSARVCSGVTAARQRSSVTPVKNVSYQCDGMRVFSFLHGRQCAETHACAAKSRAESKKESLAGGDVHRREQNVASAVRECLRSCHCVVPGTALGVERELVAEAEHLLADAGERGGVRAMVERFRDPPTDLLHLRFFHAARGDGGRADTDAARLHRRIGVERDGVLVDGDAGVAERLLGFGAEHA